MPSTLTPCLYLCPIPRLRGTCYCLLASLISSFSFIFLTVCLQPSPSGSLTLPFRLVPVSDRRVATDCVADVATLDRLRLSSLVSIFERPPFSRSTSVVVAWLRSKTAHQGGEHPFLLRLGLFRGKGGHGDVIILFAGIDDIVHIILVKFEAAFGNRNSVPLDCSYCHS